MVRYETKYSRRGEEKIPPKLKLQSKGEEVDRE